MPLANVRGVAINYEILGDSGPWMALSPGARRPMEAVRTLAEKMAEAGYRVLIHDRRNCGASEVVIDGSDAEFVLWADDLHELLSQHDALPAIIGGTSSGCRLSLLFARRHPDAVRGLLLWRVTGGAFAVNRLAYNYYTQFIEAAEAGGMAAVCETEHFAERIAARPENRDRLMEMDPAQFISVMAYWRQFFLDDIDLPVIGASEEDLGRVHVPAIVVPGNDRTHDIATGRRAQSMIPGSELYDLFTEDADTDLVPLEDWYARETEMTGAFLDFLKRRVDVGT